MLNRLDNLADSSQGTTVYAAYTYLGAGTIVQVDHPAVSGNGLTLSYKGSPAGSYAGFDRFGRIVWQKWSVGGTYFYGYDRNSNRLWRADHSGTGRDEAYAYDGLDRLVGAKRGTLLSDKSEPYNVPYPGDATRDGAVDALDYVRVANNYGQTTSDWERGEMNGDGTVNALEYVIVANNYGQSPTTASLTAAWEWDLEALGNWKGFREDDDSTLDWDVLDQTRLHNEVNEIDDDDDPLPGDPINEGAITETQGDSWVVPGYDAAGNMLSGPKPNDPTVRQHYKWDAWNRMVAVYADDNNEPGDLIAEYRYDAMNRRIAKIKPDSAHEGKYIRIDFYYTPDWQIAQTRENDNLDSKDTVATARKYEYIWDVRYIDAPICRDENKNADNDCTDAATGIQGANEGDEHLYYCQDANFNVTAILDGYDGAVVERYMYDPYGKPTVLNGVRDSEGTPTTEWALRSSNTFQNAILYCGYYFDDETGLYSVRHRYYHPTLGRWISRDPIEYADGMNMYEYVGSQPPCATDPQGTIKWRSSAETCYVEATFVIQIIWKGNWTAADKAAFKNGLKQEIENAFNGTTFRIRPRNATYIAGYVLNPILGTASGYERCCPCRDDGFEPRIKIGFVPDGKWSITEDWKIEVQHQPRRSSSRTSPPRWGWLDEQDVNPTPKQGANPAVAPQVPGAHEFGHGGLGLEHPGKDVPLAPGEDEYTHRDVDKQGRPVNGTRDLMGVGSEMQPFYFDLWEERLNSMYSGCDFEVQSD